MGPLNRCKNPPIGGKIPCLIFVLIVTELTTYNVMLTVIADVSDDKVVVIVVCDSDDGLYCGTDCHKRQ